jgi:hypothetical protein
MRERLTGDDLYALLLMLRQVDKRVFVIVEGDTDCQALDPHLDPEVAVSFPGHSKTVITRAILIADKECTGQVLAILDRDWVGLLDTPLESENVVYTDDYDLDATIMLSGTVLDRVLSSHTDRERRSAHLLHAGSSARDLLIRLSGTLGLLRWLSERDRMALYLKDFPIIDVLSPTHDAVDLASLAFIAVKRSKHSRVLEETIETAIVSEQAQWADLRRYVNGHDLSSAAAGLCAKRWGGRAGKKAFESAARAAFSCADLKTTALYKDVLSWSRTAGTPVWSCASQ